MLTSSLSAGTTTHSIPLPQAALHIRRPSPSIASTVSGLAALPSLPSQQPCSNPTTISLLLRQGGDRQHNRGGGGGSKALPGAACSAERRGLAGHGARALRHRVCDGRVTRQRAWSPPSSQWGSAQPFTNTQQWASATAVFPSVIMVQRTAVLTPSPPLSCSLSTYLACPPLPPPSDGPPHCHPRPCGAPRRLRRRAEPQPQPRDWPRRVADAPLGRRQLQGPDRGERWRSVDMLFCEGLNTSRRHAQYITTTR